MPILEKEETLAYSGPPHPKRWTVLIPAAGKGTRLGYDRPKILYPVLGKPILRWLLESFEGCYAKVVVVASPDGKPAIEAELDQLLSPQEYSVAIQTEPVGMGDAVLCGQDRVNTRSVVVVWGDQAALTRRTIRACMAAHEAHSAVRLTLPTIWKKNPYIHFERKDGRIVSVLQAREGEIQQSEGENDCGLFFFETAQLFEILVRVRGQMAGTKTGEFNFLPLFPLFDDGQGSLLTARVAGLEETVGVNTPAEARRMEEILRARR